MAETHASLRRQAHLGHVEKLHRFAGGGHIGHSDAEQDKRMIEKAVHEHEAHDHPGKPKTKLKLKHGGVVEGQHAKPRLDRARGGRAGKGGKKHGKTNVNVIVAPQSGGPKPVPVPVPVGGGPGAAPPPRPPMAPPGAVAGMGAPPPGLPPRPPVAAGVPGMRSRGGRAYARGGKVHEKSGAGEAKPLAAGTHVSFKYRGGGGSGEISHVVKPAKTAANTMYAIRPDKASRHPGEPALIHRKGEHLHRASGGRVTEEAGAGSGEGRIEKAREYGRMADKGEGRRRGGKC